MKSTNTKLTIVSACLLAVVGYVAYSRYPGVVDGILPQSVAQVVQGYKVDPRIKPEWIPLVKSFIISHVNDTDSLQWVKFSKEEYPFGAPGQYAYVMATYRAKNQYGALEIQQMGAAINLKTMAVFK